MYILHICINIYIYMYICKTYLCISFITNTYICIHTCITYIYNVHHKSIYKKTFQKNESVS